MTDTPKPDWMSVRDAEQLKWALPLSLDSDNGMHPSQLGRTPWNVAWECAVRKDPRVLKLTHAVKDLMDDCPCQDKTSPYYDKDFCWACRGAKEALKEWESGT